MTGWAISHKGRLFTFDGENYGGDGEVREVGGVFSRFLGYLAPIIFYFYPELKCLLADLLKTYPCELGNTHPKISRLNN